MSQALAIGPVPRPRLLVADFPAAFCTRCGEKANRIIERDCDLYGHPFCDCCGGSEFTAEPEPAPLPSRDPRVDTDTARLYQRDTELEAWQEDAERMAEAIAR